MISRRSFLASLGGFTLAQMLPGCAWLIDKPIAIAAHVWPGYEPMFLAQREGWLDSKKVSLLETPSASDSIKALSEGKVQGAALTLDEVLRARSNGLPLSVVLIYDISAGADLLVVRPSIKRLADLKGRSVTFEQGAVGELMLAEVLRAAGLTKDDVKLITLPVDQQPEAWKRGQVDACITYEPVACRLETQGAVTLFDSRQIPNTIVDVLALRSDMLDASHSGAIRHLIQGHFKALDSFRTNPTATAYSMAAHMKLEAPEVLHTFKGLVLPDAINNVRLLAGASPELLASARKLSTLMVKSGQLKQEDTMSSLIRADYLPHESQAR